ncbi:formylglycine-generating enzyme family protein [Methanosarcina sp.]|uniref:formylglycine-generating enzyme family protein n=1 Tax=Methanosarcina sp. TaxID=2213 RepID=UPI002B547681|nr:formylglycine-generating enzyme family protein [Methanosarcina sp.]HOW13451.1 formylglycine-generating enzyme family protein [Methanosarcina sp.]
MGSKISIINPINTIRSYLKKKEIEGSIEDSIEYSNGATESENHETFISSSTGIEFLLIPAGEFIMGSSPEEKDRSDCESPVHRVTIKNPFYMGKTPVTQRQWKKIMGTSPANFSDESLPVEKVSWEEVQEFIQKLNTRENTSKYRLPSEAEWEYACRAGTQSRYFFGDDESKLGDYAWYVRNAGRKTHPVGKKKPNPWGLYDMHGNVWEWVQDRWHDNYNGSPSDGSAWEDGNSSNRVSRGGSWYCDVDSCRSAARFSREPEKRLANLGFRLVREL